METTSILRASLFPVLIACGMAAAPPSNAQAQGPVLGCYIDTPAWDYPTEGYCEGVATPPASIAFEVMGRLTPYTRYSYVWTGCSGNGHFCLIQNAGTGPGGRLYTATVLITDHQTGLTYTRTASARVYRNW